MDSADALVKAAYTGDRERVTSLLKDGADPNAENARGRTPLFEASADERNYEVVKVLLEHGADPNGRCSGVSGETPLFVASADGRNYEVVKVLLEHGADPNGRGGVFRETPLFAAAGSTGTAEIVRLLLENGADPNAEDDRGFTPLMQAATDGFDVEVVKSLLGKGADVNHRSPTGETALLQAAGCFKDSYEVDDDKERVRRLAEEKEHYDVVRLLLDAGADVNVQCKEYGRTPLFYAEWEGAPSIARLLLERGADPSLPDKWGRTPSQMRTRRY